MPSEKVVTGEARLSYVHLFEPRSSNEGEAPKYSVSVLIPKTDTATINAINAAINKVIQSEKAAKFGGKDKGLKMPLRDGDLEKDDPAYEGHMFFNCSDKRPPIVLDENRQAILDPRAVYSGCYGRVSVSFYAFNSNGSKGVAAGLNAVMKTRDGENLGGGYTEEAAANDFGLNDDLM